MQSPIRDSKNSPPSPSVATVRPSILLRSPAIAASDRGPRGKTPFLLLLLLLQTPRTHVRCYCRNCSSSRNGGRGGGGSEDVDLQPSAHRRRHPSAGVRLHSPHAAACSSAGARFSTYTRAKHRKVGPTPGFFFLRPLHIRRFLFSVPRPNGSPRRERPFAGMKEEESDGRTDGLHKNGGDPTCVSARACEGGGEGRETLHTRASPFPPHSPLHPWGFEKNGERERERLPPFAGAAAGASLFFSSEVFFVAWLEAQQQWHLQGSPPTSPPTPVAPALPGLEAFSTRRGGGPLYSLYSKEEGG